MGVSRLCLVLLLCACGDDPVKKLPDAPLLLDMGGCGDCDAPNDIDGDGSVTGDDCDDNDPSVHPGAPEICNAKDDNCDNAIDELSATFDDGTNAVDISAVFAAGTAAAPALYTPPGAGTLQLCGASTYFARITADENLIIAGKSMDTTIVDAALTGSVITVATSSITVTIRDLTVAHGASTTNSPVLGQPAGGGIFCTGATLQLSHVRVLENTAEFGGGILSERCTTDIVDSVLTGNGDATVNGGALAVFGVGTTTITRSVISANSGSTGGAIYCAITGSRIDLVDTLVTGNTAMNGTFNVEGCAATCSTTAPAMLHGVVSNTGYGVWISSTGTYTSTSCDYGTTAAANNTPGDVTPSNGTPISYDYGDNATFSCTNLTCN